MTQEDEIIHELHELPAAWGSAVKKIIVGAFVIGGWVATLEFRQRITEESVRANTAEGANSKLWRAKMESNRWTIQDHTNWYKQEQERETALINAMREENRLQELRMQRLEDNQARLQKAQQDMQKSITDKLEVTPSDVLRELKKITGSE